MLRAQRLSNKYQYYSVWFDPTFSLTQGEQAKHYTIDTVGFIVSIEKYSMYIQD
jgi:hypothetical protein